MDADQEARIADLVRELAGMLGDSSPNWRDEHVRWEIYRQASLLSQTAELLLRAVEAEPEATMASAVVVMMLERVEPSERDKWLEALPPNVRRFAEARSVELGILDLMSSGDVPEDFGVDTVGGWTDWLQRKIVESTRNVDVLEILASHARTKKVRRLAHDALRGSTQR